ncbi:hypothetical protein [Limosilactobacillus allomucosae]|uniref:hypothetical protein n=1 Tax=Limosilactobacillus TaxID=2742598 RepID=UPI003266C262
MESMVKRQTAFYISIIQYVFGSLFGNSIIIAFLSGLVTIALLGMFSTNVKFNNSDEEVTNGSSSSDDVKTREQLKDRQK